MKNTILNLILCIPALYFSQENHIEFSSAQLLDAGADPRAVVVLDVNGDSKLDAVVATGSFFDPETDSSLFTFIQNDNGELELSSVTRYDPEGLVQLVSLRSADFNEDGYDDIVVGYNDNIKIYESAGDGTYLEVLDTFSGTIVDGVTVNDIDNDGFLDIAVSHWTEDFFRVFWGAGGFNFTSMVYTSLQSGWDQIISAKVGIDDTHSVIINKGQGWNQGIEKYNFEGTREVQSVDYYQAPDNLTVHSNVADRNNDGFNEIISACNSNDFKGLAFFDDLNNSEPTELFELENPGFHTLTSRDLDLDGNIEFIAPRDNFLYVVSNGETKTFSIPAPPTIAQNGGVIENDGVSIGDINNDGLNDVLIASPGNGLIIMKNETGSTLSIEEISQEHELFLYPNPAQESFSISKSPSQIITSVLIFSVTGKKVYEVRGNNLDMKYDLSEFERGIYLVFITSNKGQSQKKLIKN